MSSMNGVNGVTGEYWTDVDLAAVARLGLEVVQGLSAETRRLLQDQALLLEKGLDAVPAWLDANSLGDVGWGVIFADQDPDAVTKREALQPLLQHRKAQAGALYKEFFGFDGYRQRDTKKTFLKRHGAPRFDSLDEEKVPYYLLFVGSPEHIPFEFQYALEQGYAVGRIAFDRVEDYARYAESVVAAESQSAETTPPRNREITFFSVRNKNDTATLMSNSQLVPPVHDMLKGRYGAKWQFKLIAEGDATKKRLQRILGEGETPALLFTASHGMGIPIEVGQANRQFKEQGALICSDWEAGTVPKPEQYMAGHHLSDDADIHGLIAFHFACYSAGTPANDDFAHRIGAVKQIAPRPFVAQLPKRLLAHPKGGALAVIGHVERAWGTSFTDGTKVFQSVLAQLLMGNRVGRAMSDFNDRYARIATEISSNVYNWEPVVTRILPDEDDQRDRFLDEIYKIANLWTAHNDARAYVIIGDPAVRVAVGESE